MRESSTHTSIKLCVRITGSLKALNSKNTSCVNTNLTTCISHVAQCTLFGTLHSQN